MPELFKVLDGHRIHQRYFQIHNYFGRVIKLEIFLDFRAKMIEYKPGTNF